MEKLQAAVCAVGIGITVAALFGMLFPNGNIKKAAETGLTVLLLFLLASPFLQSGNIENRILTESLAYDLETFSTVDVYQNAVASYIQTTLKNAGIPTQSVRAAVQLDDDNTVLLQTVQVEVSKDTDTEVLLQVLEDCLEIPPEIVTVQGE
ncbi:MAG: hypothetical protein Q4E21_02750 [Clostridia bacterium]|nr:hypothetical protein [Clostridia bacterium]